MSPQRLERLVCEIFVAAGMSEEHGRLVAQVLVWADLRGMGSHGVMRVPRYIGLIRNLPRREKARVRAARPSRRGRRS